MKFPPTIAISLLFLIGSLTPIDAGNGGNGKNKVSYLAYKAIEEFGVVIVDSDTGKPVGNTFALGEFHSKVLYFWMEFNCDEYSYRIRNEGGGLFILPISDLLMMARSIGSRSR